MTAALRLAAILAADVVGYSRLMGENEAGTAKLVRERREAATPIVRSFGGRLVKTTGDGVLLEFPSVTTSSFPNVLYLLREPLNSERTEFRLLIADLTVFFVLY